MKYDLQQCLISLKKGLPIVVIDDKNREDEADLVASCDTVTKGALNFMVKHGSGVICMTASKKHLEENLKLQRMESKFHGKDSHLTPFYQSFEASSGIKTGISANDRFVSIKKASYLNASNLDIVSPGHVFPLMVNEQGLKGRQGHTEASSAICELAGLSEKAVIVELPDEDGNMLRGERLKAFVETYNIPAINIKMIQDACENYNVLEQAKAYLPTEFGDFQISTWINSVSCEPHIALVKGDLKGKKNVAVRVHSECLTGDVFHSLKCDCGEQLKYSLNYIKEKGEGVLLWLRQEGRGIGIINKIKAYKLQEQGFNTIDANLKLNLPVDAREWNDAINILKTYQVESFEILTNNPDKVKFIKENFKSTVKHIKPTVQKHNKDYLETKKTDMKHDL